MSFVNKIHTYLFSRLKLIGTRKMTSKSTKPQVSTINNIVQEEVSLKGAKDRLKKIFYTGLNSVKPHKIIQNKVTFKNNELCIDGTVLTLKERVYLVGFGKAVMGMAIAIEKLLKNQLIKGIVSIPRGLKSKIWENVDNDSFPLLTGVIDYRENSLNNQPDDDTLIVTQEIINLAKSLTEKDTLIVLISGGGSALCSMPHPSITSEEKLNICKKLFNSGADIKEVNLIRQKLSMVKAGGLAKIAYPAQVIGLILSDIIGDPVELIASGPTVYSVRDPEIIETILKKYDLLDKVEDNLKHILLERESNEDKLFIDKIDNKDQFLHVNNFIIGNNSLAIANAKIETIRQSLNPIVLCNNIEGLVSEVSLMYSELCQLICEAWSKVISKEEFQEALKNHQGLSWLSGRANEIYQVLEVTEGQGLVLIAGGEPTIIVKGSGKGGRNQELALTFSFDWYKAVMNNSKLNPYDVLFLSAGTDGQDGPTDATGAFGYAGINFSIVNSQQVVNNRQVNEKNNTYLEAKVESVSLENVLKNNDSYSFYSWFKEGDDLLKTGFTGTNVMDLHLIYIKKRQCKCLNEIEKENSKEEHCKC
ncbi:glycerate kinase [Chelonus insularis]|uniref:glycerate kinase n=1 Tax=Chelonus insularis TaxID=460826 RepID=UPI00158CBF5D|nr:glycerate kinase [Chelonus insularis]